MLTPTRFLDACRRRCGDYFTLRPTPDREVVVTADPAAVKKVFTGDPNLLHAGEGNVTLAPLLGSGSVLLLDGAEHLRHRRLLLPPFHGERMRAYGEMMEAVAERRIAEWPEDRDFAVLPSMQGITLEVIMRAVFGFEDAARRERIGGPLRQLLDAVASRPRVLALALTAGPRGPAEPGAASPRCGARRRPAPRGDQGPPGRPARRRRRRHLLDAARGPRPGRGAAERLRAPRRADDAAASRVTRRPRPRSPGPSSS